MRNHSSALLLFFAIALCTPALAQDSPLMWLGEYIRFNELPILHPAFSNYSEHDLDNFRDKLKAIRADATALNEWEGRFVPGGEDAVGYSLMDISFRAGFARLYIYTCHPELRSIDYGSAIDKGDIVELVSDVPSGSPRKPMNLKLVKVRWGKHLFLVEEKWLGEWVKKAVGIHVVSDDDYEQNWTNYWESGEPGTPYLGVPSIPADYRHLSRKPIETTIATVRPRRIVTDFSNGISFHGGESVVYRVRINTGSNGGVRKGMKFLIRDTDEELVVTGVAHRSADAVIVRAINSETRLDHCLSPDAEVITCPTIKAGMKVSTVVGRFYF